MNKVDFLFEGIRNDCHKDLQWLISILSYVHVDESSQPRDYDLLYKEDKALFYHPENGWTELDGKYDNVGIFIFNEKVDLAPGVLENAPDGIKDTTVGRIIQNKILLCMAFGEKIPYINNRFSPKDVEKILEKRLKDTPPPGAQRNDKDIYVDEYLVYCDAGLFLAQLTQVCVPGVTRKAITAPPNAKEHLDALLEQYKDTLDDPATIALIGKKMEELDLEYLKGDRSLGFLINSKKDLQIVRKKLHLIYGIEGFDKNEDGVLITKPLSEGIDYKNIDAYINGSRSGSFSRGHETQLGGVAVKELLRSSSNISIGIPDCNTKLGMPTQLNESNINTYINFYIIENGEDVLLTEENKDKYIDKKVSIRSPAYCKAPGTTFCARCVGPHLSLHENGISAAVAAMGSVFLNTFMKAMHGKNLETRELNLDKLIN